MKPLSTLRSTCDSTNSMVSPSGHRTIYNMCTQKPPHDYSEQLYIKYKDAFNVYVKEKVRPPIRHALCLGFCSRFVSPCPSLSGTRQLSCRSFSARSSPSCFCRCLNLVSLPPSVCEHCTGPVSTDLRAQRPYAHTSSASARPSSITARYLSPVAPPLAALPLHLVRPWQIVPFSCHELAAAAQGRGIVHL